ncbi:MAG: hypothetical protein JF618_05700, partial [Leifsonia sp.]|nr:hypothetical protein [Leifsonia sp.]
MHILLERAERGVVRATWLEAGGAGDSERAETIAADDLAAFVRSEEAAADR